ncbi:hypothetical protein Tco_0605975 [Tanacetum coccineum]
MAVEDDINVSGDTGDNSNKDENLGSLSELNVSFGDTLNYNKLGFVDGTGKRDNKNLLLANQWDMCNSVAFTWILNSLSPYLFTGAMYAKAAFEMWNDLKETYDKVYGSVVFNLNKSINSLNQNGSTLAEYYNNLNSLSKQFDVFINLSPCTREAAKHFEKHNQLINLMQFLMGLDESYLEIRSNILTKEPLPLVKAAFAVVSGEESHRNATFVRAAKPAATAFVSHPDNGGNSGMQHNDQS